MGKKTYNAIIMQMHELELHVNVSGFDFCVTYVDSLLLSLTSGPLGCRSRCSGNHLW